MAARSVRALNRWAAQGPNPRTQDMQVSWTRLVRLNDGVKQAESGGGRVAAVPTKRKGTTYMYYGSY